MWLVVLGAVAGALLILGLERHRTALRDWLRSEPAALGRRAAAPVFLPLAIAVSAPLHGFAAYLWSLGARVLRTGTFPSPGHRVPRDTPVVVGAAAVSRGRRLKAWRLVGFFGH